MASKTASRSLQSITQRARGRCSCSSASLPSIRAFSASAPRPDVPHNSERPRWSYTPERMKAPFPAQAKNPEMDWVCNSDPQRLDQFYIKFLGRGGDAVLSDEIKWLAITHKSFDQGRRGFNDRMAFFGRRILNLQASLALLHSPIATQTQAQAPADAADKRVPFTHPALDGLQNLTDVSMAEVLSKKRLAGLAAQLGMREVLRWKPRMPANLDGSGIDAVLTSTLYAIIGAIAMQKGADVANHVVRERVLKPLGIS